MASFTKELRVRPDYVRVTVLKDGVTVLDRVYWYFMKMPWAIKIAIKGANRWGDKLIKILENQEV